MKEVNLNASKLHKSVYTIVKECYPNESIRQEEPIKVDGKTLFLDIYIPRIKLAIECDGKQHDQYSQFYHGNAAGFAQQKKNDIAKREYCENQDITLVRIKYDDKLSKENVMDKILEAFKK